MLARGGAGMAAQAADGPPPAPAESVEDIVVTARKLSVEKLIDRTVYSVPSDVQSTFGTLSDVLADIPSVDVDPDGIVSLRGDTHVLILIDGKPATQFSGSSAGDNLQSLSAKDIERIEVLTTPPAQFKADGAAGVINIITRKSRTQGTSGSVQGSLGNSGRSYVGAEGGYGSKSLAASVTAGYRQDYKQRTMQSDLKAPDPATTLPVDNTSLLSENIHRETPAVGLSADYTLNERQSLNASVNWTDRGGLRTYTQLNGAGAPLGALTSSTRRLSYGHDPETDYDGKLGFTQRLARPGETLDFSLHRSTSRQHEHYDYTNDSFIPPAATFYDNLGFDENNATTEFSADYALPVAKTHPLKLGYAFEQDDYSFDNAGNNVDPLTGAQVPNPALTNDFKFRQQINSAYASYQTSSGAWTALGGLRAELTRTDARQLTNDIAQTGSYFQIYPSLHVDRSVSDEATLSFGASRRVTRPDPATLNPYVDYEYTPNLRAGNPNLRPQYTQSYEVAYGSEGRGRSYDVTAYYRLNRDSVTDLTQYLGNGLSLTTKTNLPRNDSTGIEFTANGRIGPRLTYAVSANLFHDQIDATALGITGLQSTTGLNAKVKLDYRPTAADSAQISATRTDKRLTPQGYVSAMNLVNLGYKRQLKPDLTVVATVTDVFDGQRFQRITTTPSFTEVYRRTVLGRIIYVGLVHTFGTSKSDKTPNFEYDPGT